MKAYTNCKHCWELPLLGVSYLPPEWNGPRCMHPSREKADPVYGTVLPYRDCKDARADENDCGPAGRLFKPKLRHRIITTLFGYDPD